MKCAATFFTNYRRGPMDVGKLESYGKIRKEYGGIIC